MSSESFRAAHMPEAELRQPHCWHRCAGPELRARTNLRKERVQETSTAPELLQTAGELPSCRECGAIPYLSYVRCSCR